MTIWGILTLLIGIAFLFMLIRWPGAALGFLYAVVLSLGLFWLLLLPKITTEEGEMVLWTLSVSMGALFGMAFASSIHQGSRGGGILLNALVLPVLMVLVGGGLLWGVSAVMGLLGQSGKTLMDSYKILAVVLGVVAGPGSMVSVFLGSEPRRLRKARRLVAKAAEKEKTKGTEEAENE